MDGIGVKSEDRFSTDTMSQVPIDKISHLSLDIGGSLIKMVYFSNDGNCSVDDEDKRFLEKNLDISSGNGNYCTSSGKLNFVKFETSKINDSLDFISSKLLNCRGIHHEEHEEHACNKNVIKATGGGAFKFADLFQEKLGISLDKVDEMDSLVAGANFLLKAVHSEAFTYMGGQKEYVQIDHNDLYPYLLVNIGSGVSMIKVDGDDKFERVSGTSIGGGTFWGLGKLLTKCKSFDELLELSHKGNNRVIDMLVGDIFGGMDYSKIGLSSTIIASSFGKAISENKELEDYRAEDVARSLLRMISNNIGQIAYLNALRFGIKQIFFGGFFIRGHAYTMDTISVAVNYWSNGEAKAMFLRHEGFLGALGAFLSYQKHGLDDLVAYHLVEPPLPRNVCCTGDTLCNSLLGDLNENGSIECSVQLGN